MPIPAAAIPILASAGKAALQFGQSRKQKKLAEQLRPSNYVPPSVDKALIDSEREKNAINPAIGRAFDKLKLSTASTIDRVKEVGGSSGEIQSAVADADFREKEAGKDLAVRDAAIRAGARGENRQLLMEKGRFEKASFDSFNQAKASLKGASSQNLFNAVTNMVEGGVYSLAEKNGYDTSKLPGANGQSAPGQVGTSGGNNNAGIGSGLESIVPGGDTELQQLFELFKKQNNPFGPLSSYYSGPLF